jgi:hypothetical protein
MWGSVEGSRHAIRNAGTMLANGRALIFGAAFRLIGSVSYIVLAAAMLLALNEHNAVVIVLCAACLLATAAESLLLRPCITTVIEGPVGSLPPAPAIVMFLLCGAYATCLAVAVALTGWRAVLNDSLAVFWPFGVTALLATLIIDLIVGYNMDMRETLARMRNRTKLRPRRDDMMLLIVFCLVAAVGTTSNGNVEFGDPRFTWGLLVVVSFWLTTVFLQVHRRAKASWIPVEAERDAQRSTSDTPEGNADGFPLNPSRI